MFLRRSLANPLRVAALLPSSPALAELVARHLPDPGDRMVLELGAGTGAITEALARRVTEERLLLVEIDERLCAWLRRRFPRATVLHGDIARLTELLPADLRTGRIAAIVSGVPVSRFPLSAQQAYVDQCFAALDGDGPLLQYSYMPFPPLRCRHLGIRATRLGTNPSVPPLFLWRFARNP